MTAPSDWATRGPRTKVLSIEPLGGEYTCTRYITRKMILLDVGLDYYDSVAFNPLGNAIRSSLIILPPPLYRPYTKPLQTRTKFKEKTEQRK